MNAPILPETAPFTTEQRGWLNGYLAGIFSAGNLSAARPEGPTTPASSVPTRSLRILYASQSGNAESLAFALGERLRGADAGDGHVWGPEVLPMERHAEVDWKAETHVVFATSTWGDGDMPDNGVAFWNWLSTDDALVLSHLRFAVLGLGDRNYARFCAAARRIDERMDAIGAARLLDAALLDTDYESASASWRESLASALGAGAAPAGGSSEKDPVKTGWSKSNPFPAPLVENRRLNARESAKDTRHIALSLAGSGLTYKAGDALGVWPVNHFELVDSLVLACNASGREPVRLADGQEMSFRAALLSRMDLNRPIPEILSFLADSSPAQGDRRRIRHLLSEEGAEEREQLLGESDVLDILRAFPTARLEPQSLVDALRKLSPRLYSISSSPLAHPGEVHLTVGIQKTRLGDRLRLGAASSFLASRVPLGLPVNVFVQPSSHFHPPQDPSRDLIMCGPGTGIAPFRGFLHERAASGATGRNWLFFGDQREQQDFLYRDEILDFRGRGVLHQLDLAFSRDQEEKIYVQTRMRERARELWSWLDGGAVFCVCGDAKRMAKDVDAALVDVIRIGGGKSHEEAVAWVQAMAADKRYLRDVY
ncbi:MAG: sulfite reductase subunit alpha [Fibrobacteria bacterium]|nr:sulfite reductase subunit alpha [Fibrobacteria bacterium]